MMPVTMPKVNENMAEATLQEWLVKVGQEVKREEPLCQIITDKATFDLPSPQPGIVRKLFGVERSVLPVGYILCVLGLPDEPIINAYAEKNKLLLEAHRGAVEETAPLPTHKALPASLGPRKIRATPAARRKARANNISLEVIAATLPDKGLINEKDVDQYISKM